MDTFLPATGTSGDTYAEFRVKSDLPAEQSFTLVVNIVLVRAIRIRENRELNMGSIDSYGVRF